MSGQTDIVVSAPQWDAVREAQAVVTRAIEAARAQARETGDAAIAVLLCDDAEMHRLNLSFRRMDKPTNVLSFPSTGPMRAQSLGDIAIAYETVAREAQEEGKTLLDHLAHMAVHGALHLCGYDHESDEEAAEMEDCERRALASLGIADPYAEKAA
ncbi:MAG: rRNA maturation RNase YbeY [Hyphomicrobiales bacterium]|nr:rRNA maturation RNase YbeY [Hyphomicrobiales bacterium]